MAHRVVDVGVHRRCAPSDDGRAEVERARGGDPRAGAGELCVCVGVLFCTCVVVVDWIGVRAKG